MEKSIYYFIYSPPGPDGWKDLFHHFSEVCRGQGLDSVDGAVRAVVIIHLVLGQRHLARIYIEAQFQKCIASHVPGDPLHNAI